MRPDGSQGAIRHRTVRRCARPCRSNWAIATLVASFDGKEKGWKGKTDMHPVKATNKLLSAVRLLYAMNTVLSHFGVRLSKGRTSPLSKDFIVSYSRNLAEAKKNKLGFRVFKVMVDESGSHPGNHVDYECAFASHHIARITPQKILDVGSYRLWIIGLLANYSVVTVDARERKTYLTNEQAITCDAKDIKYPSNSFDVVTSLCAIEHFGLGRYGDEFDLSADKTAFEEMVRVLRPQGHLIYTTTITRADPSLAFNAARTYGYEMLTRLSADLVCVEEKFYSRRIGGFCSRGELTDDPYDWDVYCGCWKKK